MEIGELLTESVTYAKEALIGKWTRWAIFVLFALPFSLVQFVFDPKKFTTPTGIDWSAVPWGQVAVLAGIGFILSFFLSGYTVRIYRGIKPAPDFNEWGKMFVDGVKLAIVWFLWFLPLLVILIATIAVAFASFISIKATDASAPNLALLGFILVLLLVECILFVVVMLFGIIGAVRFSRTGSIREGIRASAILATIRSMGWFQYILALIMFIVVSVIYVIVTMVLSLIPIVGWAIVLIVTPLFTIFTARYFALVYDQGEPQPVVAAAEPAPVL
jgi:hypothetical protein